MYNNNTVRRLAAGATIAGLLLSAVPTIAAGGPSVTLSSSEPSPTANTSISITASLSTTTTAFDASDVSVTNATVGNFSGSGTSYSFTVSPTVSLGDPDGSHYVITVQVNDNAFDGNDPSNTLTFGYDPTMASSSNNATTTDTTAPSITFIDPSPADGSTVSTSSVVFAFTTNDASSTTRCSVVGTSSLDSFYSCGSPQSFSLPNGAYRFAVEATDTSNNAASSSRVFTVVIATSSTPADTGTPSGGSGGGGGGSTASTPPKSVESGSGSAIGGPPAGHAIIPTVGSPVVIVPSTPTPTPVVATTPTNTGTMSVNNPPPTVSQSSGGSALVPTASPSTATPGTPDTGTDTSTNTSTSATDNTPLVPNTGDLSAAAAQAGTGIPGWAWLVLAALVLIAIGVWALRQPA